MKYTIGFVGVGKRAKSTYLPVIKKMNPLLSVVGFYVRDEDKGKTIAADNDIDYVSEVQQLFDCFSPSRRAI